MNIVNNSLKSHFMRVPDVFHAQRDRWILWSPVGLGAGIAFYFSLSSEPPFFIGALAMAVLGAFYWPASGGRMSLFFWAAAMLFALGFTAAQMRTWVVTAPVLQKETYPLTLEGKVVEVDALPKAYRVVLDEISVTAKWPPKVLPRRVRVKLKGNDPAVPEAGDILRVKAVLLPLSAPVLPGAFDFQRHAFFKRLGATGYAVGNAEVVTPRAETFFFEKARHFLRDRIGRGIENRDTAAIVTAFLIGESKGISEDTWETIRQAGIAHLLAISGFHITVLSGFLFFGARALLALFPPIALRYPIKKISALIAICGAVFYMLLIGSPVPAQRAVIMACVVMVAVMIDRDPFTLRLAAFAAVVILLLQPESLVGPSFQLSFAAVVALIAFYESIRGWWSKTSEDRSFARRYSLYVLGCFLTTLVASAATAAFALYHFARVPLFSGLLTNMIAVPVSSFVTFPLGILSFFLMPFGLEKWPLFVTGKSIDVIMAVATEAAAWPYAVYHADAWPVWMLAVMTLGGLWLCIWRGKMRFLGLMPIAVCVWMIPQAERPDVLVSGEGKLFALRSADGILWISSSATEKFIRDEWKEREGGGGVRFWKTAPPEIVQCDETGCKAELHGRKISFVSDPERFADECADSDIVFSGVAKPEGACENPKVRVLDKYALRAGGSHAVYIGEGGIIVRNVAEERGKRPWTGTKRYPARKKGYFCTSFSCGSEGVEKGAQQGLTSKPVVGGILP